MLGLVLVLFSIGLFIQKRYYYSLLILFFLLTNGFQIFPIQWIAAGFSLDKGSDYATMIIVAITFLNFSTLIKVRKRVEIFKWVFLFLFFLIIDALYSILVLKYNSVDVIQVLRQYMSLLSFVVFFSVPKDDLIKVLKAIAIITVAQSALFLTQIALHKTLISSAYGSGKVIESMVENTSFVRYYNLPGYLIMAMFYFLFTYKFESSVWRIVTLGILAMTIVAPLHRSFILTIVAVTSLFILLRQSFNKKVIYFAIGGITMYFLSFIDIIRTRIDTAFADLQGIYNTSDINALDITTNTLAFRLLAVTERFDYMMAKSLGWLFGIGLLSDHAPQVRNLPFIIGVYTSTDGKEVIGAIDTSDLCWSPLLLQTGVVGTVLYILMLAMIVAYFYKKIDISYGSIAIIYIVVNFLLSMTSDEMIRPLFRVMVMLVLTIVIGEVHVKENQRMSAIKA